MAENIIAKNAIIGSVAALGIKNKDTPQRYRKIVITSNTTNIRI